MKFLKKQKEKEALKRLIKKENSFFEKDVQKKKFKDEEQEVLFELPLILESLVLLVRSGLGILPALKELIERNKHKNNKVIYTLNKVYNLSAAGMPLTDALQNVSAEIKYPVLQHVLLHLDINAHEGGSLMRSLEGLSNYCHNEWKLHLEEKLKRLEHLVVIPVFVSVIGLMLIIVAVPLVPMLEMQKNLKKHEVHSIWK